jgi:hypothetical protein
MHALIGYTGFVGSHLIDETMDMYNRSNIETICGREYDRVYCAGLPGEKWKANKSPEEDLTNLRRLIACLATVKCRRFILLSTVDVYTSGLPQSETPDAYPNVYTDQPYGHHRRMLEEWALQSRVFDTVHIFRLPALFGHGLKKNALYDLITGNRIDALRGDWQFQWYNLGWIREDIEHHISANHSVVNLVTPPISLSTICTLFFPTTELSVSTGPVVRYALTSDYGYSHSIEDVLVAMAHFIRNRPLRLLVSELGWPLELDPVMEPFLRSQGICDREIVPTKRNWDLREYRAVYSAQSLLYGMTIQIFQEQERFLSLMHDRIRRLAAIGTRILIFGSPLQRVYSGEDAIGLFRKIGDICRTHDVVLCIENVARAYGSTWCTTAAETADFVNQVNHPAIRMNLDVGSMRLEGETTIPDIALIGHVQISFPKLGQWETPDIDLRALLSKWTGRISLEMAPTDRPFASVRRFVREFSPSQKSQ